MEVGERAAAAGDELVHAVGGVRGVGGDLPGGVEGSCQEGPFDESLAPVPRGADGLREQGDHGGGGDSGGEEALLLGLPQHRDRIHGVPAVGQCGDALPQAGVDRVEEVVGGQPAHFAQLLWPGDRACEQPLFGLPPLVSLCRSGAGGCGVRGSGRAWEGKRPAS